MVTKNRNVGSGHGRSATWTPRELPTGALPESSLLASEFVRIAGHERSPRMATLESSLLASEIVRTLAFLRCRMPSPTPWPHANIGTCRIGSLCSTITKTAA
jgi:hypothetical protein